MKLKFLKENYIYLIYLLLLATAVVMGVHPNKIAPLSLSICTVAAMTKAGQLKLRKPEKEKSIAFFLFLAIASLVASFILLFLSFRAYEVIPFSLNVAGCTTLLFALIYGAWKAR